MNVTAAHRTRHIVVRVDRGEELPAALIRALDEAEARAAFITGIGAVEAAEIVVFEGSTAERVGSASAGVRRIDAPCAVVSLIGDAALSSGVLSLRLSATLARETELGPQIIAGQLRWARVASLDLHVVALDDVALHRSHEDRAFGATLTARSAGASPLADAPRAEPPRGAPPAKDSAPEAAVTPGGAVGGGPTPPQRPMRHSDDVDIYPEVGDAVMHFHFGECTVVSSDGDRIRLRQDRDGRVREVALAMLKIEPPTEADGKRHFKLHRKN